MKRLGTLLLLLGALGACVTPVIPLPPPPLESLGYDIVDAEKNLVAFSGAPNPNYPGYFIFLLNTRSGTGTITLADPDDGSFRTEPVQVFQGDQVELWAARGPDEAPSDVLCVTLDDSVSGLQECQTQEP